ncbi:hypothetical protein BASA81_014554 [Batrachochytrium salamandrivorans]|nr:hypothetical protein BASA81_014554 [Batrachochytrium salamandrivorans]
MSMSTCMIVFNPDNWDVLQQITGVFAPLFVGSYDLPGQLASKTKLLAKAETVSPLSAELSTVDTLNVTRRGTRFYDCSIKKNEVKTFDEISFSFNKPGWYKMVSTRDIEVQVFIDECTAGLPCIKKVLARYGSTAMGMDVSGPVKNINEYPPTCWILITRRVLQQIRDSSPDNRLIGSDGKSYTHEKENEVAAFVDSWRVKAKDVLTNPRARTLNLPARPGTVCKFPKNPPPKPTTTTVDLSKSTLYPTITYALSSTTITTSPSTTSHYIPISSRSSSSGWVCSPTSPISRWVCG